MEGWVGTWWALKLSNLQPEGLSKSCTVEQERQCAVEKRGSRQPPLEVHLLIDVAVVFPLKVKVKVRSQAFQIHVPGWTFWLDYENELR